MANYITPTSGGIRSFGARGLRGVATGAALGLAVAGAVMTYRRLARGARWPWSWRRRPREFGDRVEQALEASFPASDAPSWSTASAAPGSDR
jgi:hypothetical protein